MSHGFDEFRDIAESFLGMDAPARVAFINALADSGLPDKTIREFYLQHKKLENENR